MGYGFSSQRLAMPMPSSGAILQRNISAHMGKILQGQKNSNQPLTLVVS